MTAELTILHEELITWLRGPQYDFTAQATRSLYLEIFRGYIGENIFLNRVPTGVNAMHTCVITPIAVDRDYYCSGESDLAYETVQIDIYSQSHNASQWARYLHDCLRLSLSSYGGLMGSLMVRNAQIMRESLSSAESIGVEGSEYRYSADWNFAYIQTVAGTTA